MKQKWIALKNKTFKNYMLSQLISTMGTAQQNTVVIWLTFEITQSPAWVGLQFLISQAPAIFLSTLAGHTIDRFGYKKVLLVCSYMGFLQAFLFGLSFFYNILNIQWLIFFSVWYGVVSAFELNARQTLITAELKNEDLKSGVTLNGLSISIGRMVGPALLVLFYKQLLVAFFFNALTFLAVAYTCHGMKPHQKNVHATLFNELALGLRKYIFSENYVALYFCFTFLLGLIAGAWTPSLPSISQFITGESGLKVVSLLTAISALGSLASNLSLPTNDEIKHIKASILLNLFFISVSALSLATLENMNSTYVSAFFFNYAAWSGIILFRYNIQKTAPSSIRGKVIGTHTMILMGSIALGGYLGTVLIQMMDVQYLYAWIGILAGIMTLFAVTGLKEKKLLE